MIGLPGPRDRRRAVGETLASLGLWFAVEQRGRDDDRQLALPRLTLGLLRQPPPPCPLRASISIASRLTIPTPLARHTNPSYLRFGQLSTMLRSSTTQCFPFTLVGSIASKTPAYRSCGIRTKTIYWPLPRPVRQPYNVAMRSISLRSASNGGCIHREPGGIRLLSERREIMKPIAKKIIVLLVLSCVHGTIVSAEQSAFPLKAVGSGQSKAVTWIKVDEGKTGVRYGSALLWAPDLKRMLLVGPAEGRALRAGIRCGIAVLARIDFRRPGRAKRFLSLLPSSL